MMRWLPNSVFAILLFTTAGLIEPLVGWVVALWNQEVGFGVFNIFKLPIPIVVIFSILILDMSHYWLHQFMHRNKILWRLHRVHHSDIDVDVSTTFRSHPIEVILSVILIRFGVVMIFGIPLLALVIYDLAKSLLSIFHHCNLNVPKKLTCALNSIFITSDLHRIHHSALQAETDSNFGSIFSFWDRLFKTYHWREIEEHDQIKLGLDYFRSTKDQSIIGLLLQPFKSR